MASNKPRSTQPPVPENKAIQWRGDMDRAGRKSFSEHYSQVGNMASLAPDAAAKLRTAQANSTSESAAKYGKKAARLEAVQPALRDKPITMKGAVNERVKHFTGGMERSAAEGVDSGAGWYFEHHGAIAESVARHGGDVNLAIEAGAAMSPQNSPTNERAAVEARLARNAGHEYSQKDMNRSGTYKQGKRADDILHGDSRLTPHGSPKIHTYSEVSKSAVPGGNIEAEYRQRASHISEVINGTQMAGQQYFDLYGKKDSREGILNPEGNTAEDSWMNAITTRQRMAPINRGAGRGISPAKAVADADFVLKEGGKAEGAPGQAQIGRRDLVHAYNNEATIRAGEMIGRKSGLVDESGKSMVPSVLVQETAWTEARRVANADPEYNAQRVSQPKPKLDKQGQIPGQGSLF